MANLFQRLINPGADYEQQLSEAQSVAVESQNYAQNITLENSLLKESITDLMKFTEDLNWDRLDGWDDGRYGFTLDSVKQNAERIQALLAVNPTIKKGVNARVGYIWGRGVTFKGNDSLVKRVQEDGYNKRKFFNAPAHWRLEAKLSTDGNMWVARDSTKNTRYIHPIDHIAGWITDVNDPSRVIYWYVKYEVMEKNFSSGVENPRQVEVLYPAADYTEGKAKSIDGIPVDRNVSMVHMTANRQEGWILGIPDIMAAMFWARAHKELFESGTTYVKAQGKFASKVVSKTALGAQNAAARVADTPRRDPDSGEVLDSGGTAVMSGGLDYQLMGKMSGGVDFEAFDPVAGLIASALGVPIDVLLSKADKDEKSLEQSVVNEMILRQEAWSEFFIDLFGSDKIEVIWPKIKTEPEYRRLQSVEIANRTNVLSREELRLLTLEGFGLTGDPADLPGIEEQPDVAIAAAKAKDEEKYAAKQAERDKAAASVPEQGVDAGIGKLSNGADAKDARDSGTDTNVKK